MLLAYRNLVKDKTRLFISISGIALALMLILLLNGFLAGINQQIVSYLTNSPGSIIVAQKGVRNLLGATSFLPPGTETLAREMDQVNIVVPILSRFVIVDIHDKKQPFYLIGYTPGVGGGPWQLGSGRAPTDDDEIVFDEVVAKRHNLILGDEIDLLGEKFEIVGLSRGSSSWMASYIFIQKSTMETLMRIPDASSFLLVSPFQGADIDALRNQIDKLPGVNAVTKEEMAANDVALFSKVFSIPLKLMIGIAFLIGTLVVGMVIYTATVERQTEYGVLKAIGASNLTLYRVVVTQAMTSALIGSFIGIILAFGLSRLITAIRPQFLIQINPRDISVTFLAGLGMALAAGYFPVRVIAGLAPAKVFRK